MTPKIKFPVITQKTKPVFPQTSACPICGKKNIFEPNSFVVINGGALKIMGKDFLSMDDDLSGFLHVTIHGAHDRGSGKYKEVFHSVDIVSHSQNGQFDLHFCSLDCLQMFFNKIVESLASKLNQD